MKKIISKVVLKSQLNHVFKNDYVFLSWGIHVKLLPNVWRIKILAKIPL